MWFVLFDKRPRTSRYFNEPAGPESFNQPDSPPVTPGPEGGRGGTYHITSPPAPPPPPHTTAIHYASSFFPSICPFIFGCLQPSGPVVRSLPAVTVRVCSDGRQRRRLVYCFRPCGALAVMGGLGLRRLVFFLSCFFNFRLLGRFCPSSQVHFTL